MTATEIDREWWKEAVVYQIYPRSFNDASGNGVGDIPGIVEKLDYLDDLGVDVVWLSPVYESPNADNGYDIADYRAINEDMGTMDDFDDLLAGMHERDIKLLMDLVVNHTSDEHEWFQRSRRREEKYEDYYYWRDPADDGGPPNNWQSIFGGPAWTYDEAREQYYLHLFDTKQPDLKWKNPDVREEIYDMMTWWLEKGIDGFRMDVVNLISKREGLPDGEPHGLRGSEHFANGPRIHEYFREMHDRVLSNYDCMTVAEMPFIEVDDAKEYLGEDGDGLDMTFHFHHADLTYGPGKWSMDWYDPHNLAEEPLNDWNLTDLKYIVSVWQEGLEGEGWNSIYLGNHDHPRALSRFGDDGEYHNESAKVLATYLLTMRGTSYVYQGDEIGMTSADWHSLDEVRDVEARNQIQRLMEEYDVRFEQLRPFVRARSRDNARTPVQWSAEKNAGFTAGEPWIKVTENYEEINVEASRADPDSVWHYYRDLIEMRHELDVLVYGDFELFLPDDEQVFTYLRSLGDEHVLVALNVSGEQPNGHLPDWVDYDPGIEVLACNYDEPAVDHDEERFRPMEPWEARVYRL